MMPHFVSQVRLAAVASVALLLVEPAVADESRDQWQQPDRVVADLGLRPNMRVADVGCGNGYFTTRLAKVLGGSGTILAVDPSAKALDALQSAIRSKNVSNVEIVQSKGSSTCLADASCDSVLLCDVLHEVSPPSIRQELLRDIARAMRPGACLYLLDYRKSHDVKFDPYEKLIPREELIRLANDAGLQLDAEFHYLKYQVFIRFRKPLDQ